MNCFGGNKRKNLNIPEPDFKALAKLTHFNTTELKDVFSRYEDIADQTEGVLSKEAFLSIPALAFCPIAAMVFDKEMNASGKSTMDFQDFIIIIDMFSKNMPVEGKLKCNKPLILQYKVHSRTHMLHFFRNHVFYRFV